MKIGGKRMEERKSECCNSDVKTEGIPDFIGGDEICLDIFSESFLPDKIRNRKYLC